MSCKVTLTVPFSNQFIEDLNKIYQLKDRVKVKYIFK